MNKADVKAIHTIREETEDAENNGDADFFRSHCTNDVVVMPPGLPAVFGIEATVEFMREFFRQFKFRIEYTSQETQIHGDIAFDRGTFSHTITAKAGGEPLDEIGKFLWVYSRDADGSWKMARVIWNTG